MLKNKQIKLLKENGVTYKKEKLTIVERLHRKNIRKYGLSLQDYADILESQSNVCAICSGIDMCKKLSVDHDHNTGKVRGLLCQRCNTGLGLFRDNIESLNNAIIYLSRFIT